MTLDEAVFCIEKSDECFFSSLRHVSFGSYVSRPDTRSVRTVPQWQRRQSQDRICLFTSYHSPVANYATLASEERGGFPSRVNRGSFATRQAEKEPVVNPL